MFRKSHIKNLLLYIMIPFSLIGCGEKSLGNSRIGFANVPDAKVQPKEAVELVEQYLDETFKLRKRNSDLPRSENREVITHVTLKNGVYHIVKESYPAKSISFYLTHAAKVNMETGNVTPPK